MLFIHFFLQIPLITVVHRVLAALRILLIPTILRLRFAFWNIRGKIEPVRLSSRLYAIMRIIMRFHQARVFITAVKTMS